MLRDGVANAELLSNDTLNELFATSAPFLRNHNHTFLVLALPDES